MFSRLMLLWPVLLKPYNNFIDFIMVVLNNHDWLFCFII